MRSRTFGNWARPALWLGLLWAGLGGCLFSTREPSPPVGGDSSFRDPTEPDTVLRNIRVACSQNNASNYVRSLADSFQFVPDPADAALIGEEFFANWTKSDEQEVFTTVLARPDTILFTWPSIPNEINDPDHSGDKYYPDISYSVRIDSAGVDTTFSGKADLYLRQYATEWRVRSWVDKRDGSANLTLGRVRARRGRIWN